MFNFAAAVSDRIRILRSTKVHPFVPEAEDGFPAEGGGDKTHGYPRGTRSSTSRKDVRIGVGSPQGGWAPGGGRAHQLMRGGGVRSTGKTSGSKTSSSRGGDVGYIAWDARCPKTPRKKCQRRALTPWRARLRNFLTPRRGRKATVVLPLDKPQRSMIDTQAKGVKVKKSHRLDAKVTPDIDHHQLPGVPQLNLNSKSRSFHEEESDNDESGSTPNAAVGTHDSSTPTTPFAPAMGQDVTKTLSSVTSRKITSNARDDDDDHLIDASRKDAACSSFSRGNAPSTELQGVKTKEQQLPKAPKLPNREKEEAIFREHRFALGMNVSFICDSLVGCQGYNPECRWLDVMRSCILRKEELNSLLADGNQIMPYTKFELETINMNAILAIERIYHLNKLVFEHVEQKNNGVRNLRLFEPVEKLLLQEPPVSAGYGIQARQEKPSPQPEPEARTTTKTRQAAPNTVVTVAKEKRETESKSDDNSLIPRRATLVKRPKESVAPSMKVATRKLPNSKQTPTSTGSTILKHATLFGVMKPKCTAAVNQAQKKTTNVVKVAPAGEQQCSKPTAAQVGSSTKPTEGATIPNIAPSCLKKLMPHIPPYPKLDPAELQYVADRDGNKIILGTGNFAVVFLMRRRSDGTLVALKQLQKNYFRMTPDIAMLEEVTALQAVRHSPYFPKLYGVVDFRSYAQELIGDGSVNSAKNFTAARFHLSLLCRGEWLHVCRDITRAMMDLHRVCYLHNDLHTGNVMVCRNPPGSKFKWTGKMIDLGCAQSIYSSAPPLSLTKEQKQSLYQNAIQIAPEVVEGKTCKTVESDIYSLGRVFLTVAHDASCLSSLRLLGLACMKRDPKLRPKLKTVYKKINAMCYKTKTARNEQPLS